MSWVLALPLMFPFATAVLAYLCRYTPAGRWISLIGSIGHLMAGLVLFAEVRAQGVLAGQMGGWAAPFGITLVADTFSAIMVVLTGLTAVAVAAYAIGEINERKEHLGYHALFCVLIAGVTGAFLTGDLFNLYVWFEVMLIASFGLLILGGRPAQIDGGLKYVTLNLVSTILFLSGVGLLYGLTGTLNMADLGLAVDRVENRGLLTVVAIMFMIAFGVKAAVFPLFFWLPAAYHTPAYVVSAVFAALLTKVGVYSLIRTFTLIFDHDTAYTHQLLLLVACLTMLAGAIGAASQTEIRRILSFNIISSIGFILFGVALDSPIAMLGAVFYLMHNIPVKANLFLLAGLIHSLTGASDLRRTGGLYKTAPLVALLFFIPAFSLAGFPPLSGFWGKYLLVRGAIASEAWYVAGIALFAGLLTIYAMGMVWAEAFWKAHPDGLEPKLSDLPPQQVTARIVPVAALGAVTVLIGVFPEPFLQVAEAAANSLHEPSDYIAAVLGESAVAPDVEGALDE
ncbi:MAG: Na+/H+ antiporter subunit D [Pseudomonadota bacterium]